MDGVVHRGLDGFWQSGRCQMGRCRTDVGSDWGVRLLGGRQAGTRQIWRFVW